MVLNNRTQQHVSVSSAVQLGAMPPRAPAAGAQPPPRPASRRPAPSAPPVPQQQQMQQRRQPAPATGGRRQQQQQQQPQQQLNPLANVAVQGKQGGAAAAGGQRNGKVQQAPIVPSDGIGCRAAAAARPNVCGWFLSLTLAFQILSFIVCMPDMAACSPFRIDIDDDLPPCKTGFCEWANYASIGWWMLTAFFYAFLCINVCCGSSDRKFYATAGDAQDPKIHIDKMRRQPPMLTLFIRCYHKETRTRTVTSTDSQGRTTSRTETYVVDVVTHRASERFEYASWKDVSEPGLQCGAFKLSKCHFDIAYACGDPATKQALRMQYERFVAINTSDVYQSHGIRLEVEGHKSEMLCAQPGAEVPAWVGTWQYLFCSFCCFMVVPYRWAFAAISGDVSHRFTKMVTLAPPNTAGNGFLPAYQPAQQLDAAGYEILPDGRVRTTVAGRQSIYEAVV